MEDITKPIVPSITADGSWLPKVGMIEFRCVDTKSSKVIRKSEPIQGGNHNIAEFLAVATAIIHCHRAGINLPIYTDSITAIAWVRNCKANTDKSKITNVKLLDMITKAEKFLAKYGGNYTVQKWETKSWGESPADYGRK